MRGSEEILTAEQRDIDREMVAAKLNHPSVGWRRLAQDAYVEFAAAEPDGGCCRPLWSHAVLEHLIGIDDGHHLVVTVATQRRRQQRQRGFFLCRRHGGELDAVAFLRATCISMPVGRFDHTVLVELSSGGSAFARCCASSVARNASAAATARAVASGAAPARWIAEIPIVPNARIAAKMTPEIRVLISHLGQG